MNPATEMRALMESIDGCNSVSIDITRDPSSGIVYQTLWAHWDGKAFRAAINNDDMLTAIADVVVQIQEYKNQPDKEPEDEKHCG